MKLHFFCSAANVCKSGWVFPPKSVCQYGRPYVCVHERQFTLKKKGRGCEAALNRLPLTVPTCRGGHTYIPEPERGSTADKCLSTAAATFPYHMTTSRLLLSDLDCFHSCSKYLSLQTERILHYLPHLEKAKERSKT